MRNRLHPKQRNGGTPTNIHDTSFLADDVDRQLYDWFFDDWFFDVVF